MSKDAAEEIVKGRATGQKVWGEVVAGAIGLTDEKWWVPCFALYLSTSLLAMWGCEGMHNGMYVAQGLESTLQHSDVSL